MDQSFLARLDERLKRMEAELERLVTRVEFRPVAMIAYGLVGLLLSALVGAIVAQVIK